MSDFRLKCPPFLSPLLFVTFVLLNVFGNLNAGKVSPIEILPPLLALSAITLLVYGIARLAFGDAPRAEILTFTVMLLLTTYGLINELFEAKLTGWNVDALMLSLWAVIFGVVLASLIRQQFSFEIPVQVMRIFSTILLVVGIFTLVSGLIRTASRTPFDLPDLPETASAEIAAYDGPKPDIYYIILDEYVRADVLDEMYGFDNSQFIEEMESRGFYVAPESQANYLMTFLSLASSLNMQYLDSVLPDVRPGTTGIAPLFALIRNNETEQALKSAGYTVINLASGWGATNYNLTADVNMGYLSLGTNTYNMMVTRATLLNVEYERILRDDQIWHIHHSFDALTKVAARSEPTFTVAHILTPHYPYSLQADGTPVSLEAFNRDYGSSWTSPTSYYAQILAVNDLVLQTVDAILAASDTPPVIIIQGDHGTMLSGGLDPGQITESLLVERPAILNAYYLPGGEETLYPSISPVNSFRVVFNTLFDTDLPLLPDQTLVSTYSNPYAFETLEDALMQYSEDE